MKTETELGINTILEVVELLNPISVRLVLNKNIGKLQDEDLALWYKGKNSGFFQEADTKFYDIMKQQNMIQIPSIQQSWLLSNLSIGDAAAVFYPIHTEYGYYGCFWACFENAIFTNELIDKFGNICEWMTSLLDKALSAEFMVQTIARRYSDLLEQLKMPSLIILDPDHMLISNLCFESILDRREIITQIRETISDKEKFAIFCEKYNCSQTTVDFPNGKTGLLLIFRKKTELDMEILADRKGNDYYSYLSDRINGTLNLIESSGDFSNLQRSYFEKISSQTKRLAELLTADETHLQAISVGQEKHFEVISVTKILRDVVFDLAALARNKKIVLEVNADKTEDQRNEAGSVAADPWLITLMMYTLIYNAISFSKPDGKVKIETSFSEKTWSVRIQDFGIGLSPLDLASIEKDELDLDDNSAADALIQNIELSKSIAAIHKGQIDIKSVLGKGSVFTVTIPNYNEML